MSEDLSRLPLKDIESYVISLSKRERQIIGPGPFPRMRSDEEERELSEIFDKRRYLMARLAADPEKFQNIKCWVIEIEGDAQNDASPEIIQELHDLASEGPKEDFLVQPGEPTSVEEFFTKKSGDPLAEKVRLVITEAGYEVFASGFGEGDWHLGVLCTTSESEQYVAFLREKFPKQIEMGILRLTRFWYGLRLQIPEDQLEEGDDWKGSVE